MCIYIYHYKAALLQFYHSSHSLLPQPGGFFLHDQLVPRGHRHPVLRDKAEGERPDEGAACSLHVQRLHPRQLQRTGLMLRGDATLHQSPLSQVNTQTPEVILWMAQVRNGLFCFSLSRKIQSNIDDMKWRQSIHPFIYHQTLIWGRVTWEMKAVFFFLQRATKSCHLWVAVIKQEKKTSQYLRHQNICLGPVLDLFCICL